MPEGLNNRAGKAQTSDPTVSPVPVAELRDFLALTPDDDALLSPLLLAATDSVISYIGLDLIDRKWTLVHWDWPAFGTITSPNLGPMTGGLSRIINLPYARSAKGVVVLAYGEPFTDFVNRGDALYFDYATFGDRSDPALFITYTAGFGETSADVPQAIWQAIKMLAGWLFEHRGECDADMAIHKSGAASLLVPWRCAEVLV